MVNQVTSQGELALLGRSTAHAIDRRRIISRHIIGMLETKLGPKRDRTTHPEVEPHQVLAIPCLVAGTLPLKVVNVLIADGQGTVVVIKFMLDLVDDRVVRSEAMGCQGIALGPVGPDDQGRARNSTRVGADVCVGPVADARIQPIT